MNEPANPGLPVEKRRVLWLAPALNSYKLRFLNHLVTRGRLDLIVVKGQLDSAAGHKDSADVPLFRLAEAMPRATSSFAHYLRHDCETLRGNPVDYVPLPRSSNTWASSCFVSAEVPLPLQLVTYTHPYVAELPGGCRDR
jgi:hypothetical protein